MKNRNIGEELRNLNNAVRRYVDANSHLQQHENITCSNMWIIRYLSEAEEAGTDVFQRDLEEKFGITRSTASKVLTLLEKKGFITRTSVSHDARLKKITLTDNARKLTSEMHSDVENLEERLMEGFSEQELAAIFEYFERMKKNLEGGNKQ